MASGDYLTVWQVRGREPPEQMYLTGKVTAELSQSSLSGTATAGGQAEGTYTVIPSR